MHPHIINYEISSYSVWCFQSLQFDANLQGRIQDFLKGGGVICVKVWGFSLLILSQFSEISHENEIIWSQ